MPVGAGKYDELCTLVREKAEAQAVLIAVIGGNLGSGFSVQAPMDIQLAMADILEAMAKQIRADAAQGFGETRQ